MVRLISITARPGYRLFLTYQDGTSGEIDLSQDVGKGVFSVLRDSSFFETVHIGSHGQIQWTEDLEICPEAAYQELKNRISTEVSHA
ncbi:MAG: DUF2442 domain-containing protein [Chthoniobacterales bacterium]